MGQLPSFVSEFCELMGLCEQVTFDQRQQPHFRDGEKQNKHICAQINRKLDIYGTDICASTLGSFFFHDEANEDAVEGGAMEYELKGSLLFR